MKLSRTLLVAGAAFALAAPAGAATANGIEAIVHDAVVTYHEVNALTEQTADRLISAYRSQPAVLEKELQKMRDENREKLIRDQLILHEFKTAGYSLPDSLLDELVKERIRDEPFFGDRVALTKSLEARGMTMEKFRQQVRQRFIVQSLTVKNISQEIIVSPHKIEAYYLDHRDAFKVEDEVKLRVIVVNKTPGDGGAKGREMAEEMVRELKEGASFADLASLYSQESRKNKGGEWDWIEVKSLRKELADATARLKPGDYSEVIETPDVCYVMRLEDKRPAHFKSLGEVRTQIEGDLMLSERERLEKAWIDKLKKKTFVKTLGL